MEKKFQITHEFLLLFLNLSQLKDKQKIIELFVGAVNRETTDLEIKYLPTDSKPDNEHIPIKTKDNFFGSFLVQGDIGKQDAEFMAVIRNLIKMLAVVLENLEREDVLKTNAEYRYKLLFNNADAFVSVYDRNGICKEMNKKVAAQFGGNPEDFVGKSLQELHPQAAEEYTKRICGVIDSSHAQKYEDEVEFAAGKKYLLSNVHPVPDKNGQMTLAQIISHDITERKRIETKLIENEEKFKAIFMNSPDLIALTDIDGNFIDINKVAEGLSKEEVLKTSAKDYLNDKDKEDYNFAVEKALETNTPQTYEPEIILPGGKVTYWFNRVVPLRVQGQPTRLVFNFTDVTSKRQADEIVRTSEKRLRSVLDASPFPVALVDEFDDKIFYWGESSVELFGHTASTAEQWYKLAYPDDDYRKDVIARWKPIVEKAKKTGKTLNAGEYRITCKDGSVKICEIYIRFIKDHSIVTFNDITESKLAEEELKKIEWMLTTKPLLEDKVKDQGYGDLTALNKGGLIASSIDKSTLKDIVAEYLNLLETSSAIYEKNGDYAYGIFCSGWCQLMDKASRKLCDTDDNAAALSSGKWLCHESCWTDCAKLAIESRAPVDIECSGGIHLYAVPIFSAGEVIGAIDFGYGDPPRDRAKLRTLADFYGVGVEKLAQEAEAYASRPAYIIELSKQRLLSSARLIGMMVEQKQVEKELAESLERFESLHNASFGGIAIHDKGIILESNKGLSEITGYSLDELIGMDGLLLIAPESREMVMSNIMAGYEKPYEAIGLRKNGDKYPIRLEARSIPYKGKNVRTVEFRDITEQKNSQEQLIRQKYYLARAQEIGNIGTWELDIIKNELVWTEQTYKIFGVPQSKNIGLEDFIECVHPDDREYVLDQWNKAVSGNKPYDIEHRIIANGQVRWVREKAELEFDETGKCLKGTGFIQDITESKKSADLIKQGEERFRRVVESNMLGIMFWDVQGNITDANDSFLDTFGYSREDLEQNGLSWKEMTPPEFGQKDTEALKAIKEFGIITPFEKAYYHKDGHQIPIILGGAALSEERQAGVCFIIDISARKEAEQELKESQAKLQEAQNMANLGTWYWDLDSGKVTWSDQVFKIFHLSPDEFSPQIDSIMELSKKWPEDAKRHIEIMESAKKTHEVGKFEQRFLRPDGTEGYYFSTFQGVYDQDDQLIAMRGTVQDITQAKEMQKAVLDEKNLNEEYVNSLPGLFYVFDQHRFIQWNIKWEQITGYTHDEISKMYGTDFFEGEDKLRIEKHMKKVFSEGQTEVEADLVLKNGKKIPYYFTGLRKNIDGNDCLIGLGLDITERKKAEQEIKSLAKFPQENPNPVMRFDKEGKVIYSNKAAECFIDTLQCKDGVCNDPEVREHISRSFKENKVDELVLKSKDRFYSVKLAPVADLGYINFYGLDITERKKAEQEIKSLAKFPQENPNPVMRFDKEGKVIYSNKAAECFIDTLQCKDGVCNDPEVREHISRSFKENKVDELVLKSKDRFYSVKLAPVADLGYINFYGLDITERKKAEQGLVESRARFQELFDNMSNGVAIYEAVDNGQDFVFKDFNKAAEKIEQIKRQDVISKKVTEVFPGVKEFGIFDVLQRVYISEVPEYFPAKIYKDDRISGWRENYVYKIPSGEIIAVYDDVTEKKQAQEKEKEIIAAKAAAQIEKEKNKELMEAYQQLKSAQEQLLQAEKLASIGQLGAGVAHELNSPLAGVLSLLRSYKKEKDQASEEFEDLGEMEKACEHMAKIIKGLNSFARQSTGEFEEVDFNNVITSTLSFIDYALDKKGIILRTDLKDDLPKIMANENQMQQVAINMISNAADAVPASGEFKINTQAVEIDGNDFVEIIFQDTGCGIKENDRVKIFDPFFTTKRPGGGVGLGLSIVYKIIENHNGTIDVYSKEGVGTTFTIRFPAIK